MIESICRTSSLQIEFRILALDRQVENYFDSTKFKNVSVDSLRSIMSNELLEAKLNRPWREFCWTLASYYTNHCAKQIDDEKLIAYVDSDVFFFDDLSKLVVTLNADTEIFIHKHNFLTERIRKESENGIFNVGVLLFKLGNSARLCLSQWSTQVLKECRVDKSLGLCGDQKYLDEWPERYFNVQIATDEGVGMGPWNLENFHTKNGKIYSLEGILIKPVFFHFSKFKYSIYGSFMLVYLAAGYTIENAIKKLIYKPYLNAIKNTFSQTSLKSGNSNLRVILEIIFRNTYHFKLSKDAALILINRRKNDLP